MTAETLISVIIPTFKRATLVRNAIDTVRRQTYRNVEILVVDDASPDDTKLVITGIEDPRVRYIRHDTNKGVSAARNTGIRAAKGQYIALMDDDDDWREDKLEKQLQAIKRYDAVLSMGVANGYPLRVHRGPEITLGDLRKGTFNPSALLARTQVLRDVMFDENLRQGEDWDVFIRIRQKYTIRWINEPLLIYNDGNHQRATNQSKYLSGPELEKRAEMLHKHRVFFGEKWFKHHLADTFLSYIGSRPKKLSCIAYAVKRCGVIPVASALLEKAYHRFKRQTWTGNE